jgi:5-methylcytosine-specific restriction endonuclease McrBC regulatory subunit McrC
MPSAAPDFSEDERILVSLSDPVDIEAFTNLMAHAHELGVSAAEFVREEPQRTSRRTIKKLCLKDRKRSLRAQLRSAVKALFEGRPSDPVEAHWQTVYGVKPQGPSSRNGTHREN